MCVWSSTAFQHTSQTDSSFTSYLPHCDTYVLQTTYSGLHTLSDSRFCVCVCPDSSGLIKELACQKLALSLFNIDLISSYKCVCTHVCVCVLLVWHIWVCLKIQVIPHNLVFLEVTRCTWQEIRQVLPLILTYKSLLLTQHIFLDLANKKSLMSLNQIVTTYFEVVFLKTPFICIIRLYLWSWREIGWNGKVNFHP